MFFIFSFLLHLLYFHASLCFPQNNSHEGGGMVSVQLCAISLHGSSTLVTWYRYDLSTVMPVCSSPFVLSSKVSLTILSYTFAIVTITATVLQFFNLYVPLSLVIDALLGLSLWFG